MGLGVFGQLGHSNLKDLLTPARIDFFVAAGVAIAEVACGAYHSTCRSGMFVRYALISITPLIIYK